MDQAALTELLDRLLAHGESEIVEFKRAGDGFSTADIGKYFSALANEANLRGSSSAWLVFGIDDKTRAVVGTDYRPEPDRLQALKQQVLDGTEPRVSFREIHELAHPNGRVLLFQIPPAPRGIPIAWQGHFYGRAGESLGSLGLDKLDLLRRQDSDADWTAVVVPTATHGDLDPAALEAARAAFAARHADRVDPATIAGWSTAEFLDRAGLSVKGQLTRAALLLLGQARPVAHLLSPLLAEFTWRLTTEERVYEHFEPPFLLATTKVFERVRNVQVHMLQPGTLIQTVVERYERSSVLEALHNCIAHADYRTGGRFVVREHADRLQVTSPGAFVDGAPDDYVTTDRVAASYRNPFLVRAMAELQMIDRLGYGIRQLNRSQARRFLPLPDYDLSRPGEVTVTLYGAVIDQNYSEQLMARTDLTLPDVLALDRVQKGLPIPDLTVDRLRRAKLIHGRRPHLHVTAAVATATDTQAALVRAKAQDDAHLTTLLLEYLRTFGHASRSDIDDLLNQHLPTSLDAKQQRNRVTNLLSKLRIEGRIRNAGTQRAPRWEIV